MKAYMKRLRRNIKRNELLDRELDFLPSTIGRDDVREVARTYGPLRRRSAAGRVIFGLTDFFARYSAPFVGMLVGAEYAAAKALYPLIGEEGRFGDSLRLFLGENLGRKVEDMSKAFEVAGALVAATPKIVTAALYAGLLGIAAYVVMKRLLIAAVSLRRRMALGRKLAELVG
ncbi:MAG: hypothetical protein HQ583_03440 [Candidatus Abyssubacteria bacterium]|nr:hypothetical protein [Candidatus Abyssubacteria bacterium]